MKNYKADGNEQQYFRTKLNLPYLFRTPVGLGLELKIIKRDSTFVTTEQKIQAQYQINPSSIFYGGYKGYESSNLLDDSLNFIENQKRGKDYKYYKDCLIDKCGAFFKKNYPTVVCNYRKFEEE